MIKCPNLLIWFRVGLKILTFVRSWVVWASHQRGIAIAITKKWVQYPIVSDVAIAIAKWKHSDNNTTHSKCIAIADSKTLKSSSYFKCLMVLLEWSNGVVLGHITIDYYIQNSYLFHHKNVQGTDVNITKIHMTVPLRFSVQSIWKANMACSQVAMANNDLIDMECCKLRPVT